MMMQKEEHLSSESCSEFVGAGEKGGSFPWMQETIFTRNTWAMFWLSKLPEEKASYSVIIFKVAWR